MLELVPRLRMLSAYHPDLGIAEQFAQYVAYNNAQREALAQAADEIERLRARVKELDEAAATVA